MADSNAGTIYYDIDVRTEKAVDAVRTVEAANARMGKSFDSVTIGTSRAGAGMGNFGRKAGAAGIQIQQFVGQVTNGTNVMQALSMQAADIGFVLGFPLLGAVAGITAALAGPFITSLFNADDAASQFNDTIDDTISGLRSTRIEQAAGAISVLKDRIQESTDALKELDEFDISSVRGVTGRRTKLAEIEKERSQLLKDQAKDVEALAELEKRLAELRVTPEQEEAIKRAEKEEQARQKELESRSRFAQMVIAQQQVQFQDEQTLADEQLAMRLAAIEEARSQQIDIGQSYDQAEYEAKALHTERMAELEQKQTEAIQQQQQQRIAAMQTYVSAYSQLGGQLNNLVATIGAEQTALGKAVFLANQALAGAQIIVSTQQAAAQALTLDPTGTLSARVTALGYASAGIAAGVAIGQTAAGRQTGGPTEAGQMYRVGEAGPEVFSMGGRQYLIGSERGQVDPVQSGSGGAVSVNVSVINEPGVQSEVSDDGRGNLTIRAFISDMDNHGPMHRAITRNTSANGRTK
ncbi:MAG: hypothetical protein VW258_09390 [Thalassolituus sp.]